MTVVEHPAEYAAGRFAERTARRLAEPISADITERACSFACQGEVLQGVLTRPESPARLGVVVVVGGPQYRAGSHRQFVLLARALAAAGHAVLRFDCRGMGDSSGEPRSFEQLDDDIAAAIGALVQQVPAVERVVLWGLCDGASAALLYVHSRPDARVAGLCLLNPWVRSEATLARTHVRHYYRQRLMQREFWVKLLRGRVAGEAVRGFARNLRLSVATAPASPSSLPFRDRMAAAWQRFDGKLLLLLSGKDLTAREFLDHAHTDPAWRAALAGPQLERHDLAEADHTLSGRVDRERAEDITVGWLARLGAADRPSHARVEE